MFSRQAIRASLLALLACLLVGLAAPALAAAAANEFTVDNTLDGRDEDLSDGICKANVPQINVNEGTCTLRAAIEEVNEQEDTENTIKFDSTVFNGEESDSIFVSSLLGALPAIDFPTKIEAGSGCTANGVVGAPCAGVIGLEGETIFRVEADHSSIRGLSITGPKMVGIDVANERTGFEATGNWIGIGLNGSSSFPASATGILLEPGANGAVIGGAGAGERNVIASNEVGLDLEGASHATVRGNWFGVTGNGVSAGSEETDTDIRITNYKHSTDPEIKAEDDEIGGPLDTAAEESLACDGACNVISSAVDQGIDLSGDGAERPPASGPTKILANYLGLDATGKHAVKVENQFPSFEGNKGVGVSVGAAGQVTIGGDSAAAANYVVGGTTGVAVENGDGFEARGNVFGENAEGAGEAPQHEFGISSSTENATELPVISSNQIRIGDEAVAIEQRRAGATISDNTIEGGEFGIVTQEKSVPPGDAGSLVEDNLVEGASEGGILVMNADNRVFGNEILETEESGITVEPPVTEDISGNLIGGDSEAEENVIDDSGNYAIMLRTTEGSFNEIGRNHGAGNALGFIVLRPFNGPENDANGGIDSPTISLTGKTEASGTAEPGALVRVFRKASSEEGELAGFLGEGTADGSGNWKVTYEAPVPGETLVTATQTLAGGTSTLAEPVKTPPDPPPSCATDPALCPPQPPPTGTSQPPPAPPPPTKPTVTITKGPKPKSTATTAKFAFSSSEPGSKFKCKLDGKSFASCTSPKTYKKLKPGKHVFQVEAIDAAGNVSAVVKRKFTVLG